MYSINDHLSSKKEEENDTTHSVTNKNEYNEFKIKFMNASKNNFENSTIMKNRKKKNQM